MVIEVEEIIYLVQELARRHQEEAPGTIDAFTEGSLILSASGRYRSQPGRAFCLLERMSALAHLSGDSRMRGWTIKGIEEGCLFTTEAIFRAAAKCPLRADSKRVWFDPDEFFKIALSETTPEGLA